MDHRGIHEDTRKELMLELNPALSIICSHSIGSIGLLERENATILNASILTLARRTVQAFCRANSICTVLYISRRMMAHSQMHQLLQNYPSRHLPAGRRTA